MKEETEENHIVQNYKKKRQKGFLHKIYSKETHAIHIS